MVGAPAVDGQFVNCRILAPADTSACWQCPHTYILNPSPWQSSHSYPLNTVTADLAPDLFSGEVGLTRTGQCSSILNQRAYLGGLPAQDLHVRNVLPLLQDKCWGSR